MGNYLRSLHNNSIVRPQRQLRPITEDLFSQMPTQDASYEYDSFVVDDHHVSFSKFHLSFLDKNFLTYFFFFNVFK